MKVTKCDICNTEVGKHENVWCIAVGNTNLDACNDCYNKVKEFVGLR